MGQNSSNRPSWRTWTRRRFGTVPFRAIGVYASVPLVTAAGILWFGRLPGLLPSRIPIEERTSDIGFGPNFAELIILFTSPTCIHCRAWHLEEFPKISRAWREGKLPFRLIIRQHPRDLLAYRGAAALLGIPQDQRLVAYSDMMAYGVAEWLASNETDDSARATARDPSVLWKVANDAKRDALDFSIMGTPSFLIGRRLHLGGISADRLMNL